MHLENSKTTDHLRYIWAICFLDTAFVTFFRWCFVRKLRFASKLISYSELAVKTESIVKKVFFLKKSPYLPSGMVWSIMTIFSITQPVLDGSFSSSNSIEILMRQFCAHNFSSIECNCEDIRTH